MIENGVISLYSVITNIEILFSNSLIFLLIVTNIFFIILSFQIPGSN